MPINFLDEEPITEKKSRIRFLDEEPSIKKESKKSEELNIFGNIFNRPAAAIRAGIIGSVDPKKSMVDEYIRGANDPLSVETFLQSSQAEPGLLNPKSNVLASTAVGTLRDVGSMVNDFLTNPADIALAMAGKVPGISQLLNMAKNTKQVKTVENFLTKQRSVPVPEEIKPITVRVNNLIDKTIEKSIRPSVSGKGTFAGVQAYRENAREAVKTITENKTNLSFIDDSGQIINKLPENLEEFSIAIAQTKRQVFKKYDRLLKEAGSKGAFIDLNPLAGELDKVINNKALGIKDPGVIKYAQEMRDRLISYGELSIDDADDLIKFFNDSLKNFYKNPTFEMATRAHVDASIANNLRRSLDDHVSSITGKEFQNLKNKYGALKAIENDVNRRLVVDARKNIKGLLDFTDVFSAGDVIHGIVSMNPAQIAKGAFQTMIKNSIKEINSPNRMIKSMFQNMERMHAPRIETVTPEILRNVPISKMPQLTGPKEKLLLPGYRAKFLPAPENVPFRSAKNINVIEETIKGEGFVGYPAGKEPIIPAQYKKGGEAAKEILRDRWREKK